MNYFIKDKGEMIMDERTLLESALFAHLEPNGVQQELQVHPNMSQGVDVTTSNGEVLFSINPGVSTEGATLFDASGDKIATIRDSVHGTTVYDMGGGETAVSIPDIFNGSKILDHGEGFIGFTKPSFSGGMDLQNSFHQPIMKMNPSGNEMFVTNPVDIPDFTPSISGNTFDGASAAFDAADTADSLNDASDFIDVFDTLGDIF